jgi:hypothetical protein
MSDNWVVQNLINSFNTWNDKLGEIWSLISESPVTFKGGEIWIIIVGIHGALQAIGYSLLILFFAVGVFQSAASFRDFKRPELTLRFFIRFAATKTIITYGMDIMLSIFDIISGIVSTIANQMGSMTNAITIPPEMVEAIENVGFWASIPLWLVSLLGSLFITVLSFVMILTVYGRFFRLYLYTAIAPVPLSAFGGETTSATGKAFVKSYIGVCMEGAIIVLACLIYSAFVGSGTIAISDPSLNAVTIVWRYLCEVVFNLLILVGLIKGADRIAKELMNL